MLVEMIHMIIVVVLVSVGESVRAFYNHKPTVDKMNLKWNWRLHNIVNDFENICINV